MTGADRPPTDRHPRRRALIYGAAALALLVLAGVGLAAFHRQRDSRQASARADQAVSAFHQAGLVAPDKDVLVRTLGADGGPLCADPGGALARALLKVNLANGAGGPGQRPVVADRRVVAGARILVGVYCPDRRDEFDDVVAGLKTAAVVRS